MDSQRKSSPLPGSDSQGQDSANAPADAAPPSFTQEAASADVPTGPVAGQKIEPQNLSPAADTGHDSSGTPAPTDTPDMDKTQGADAEPTLPADTSTAPSPVGPPKRRKRGLLVGLVVAAVVLLLSGGAAAAYYGYYVPNKPENVLKSALANSVDKAKAKSTQFSGELAFKGQSRGEDTKMAFDGALDAESGATKLHASWDALVTSLTFDLVSADGKTFYAKFGGLRGLDSLLQGIAVGEPSPSSPYASAIAGLNDQWLQINESMVKSALGSDNASPALSGDDRTAIAQAYTSHPFLSVKEALPDAKIEGKDSHHYRLAFNAGGFVAFNRALKDADSSLFNADEAALEELEQELGKLNTDKLNLEVWISKKDKMFTQFAVAYEDVSLRLTVKSYNQPVDVTVPEDSKSILEVLGGVLGGTLQSSDLTFPTLEDDFQTGISL